LPKAEKKKILFLVPYPIGHAPSQRFRVELFLPYLTAHEISYTVAPFLNEKTFTSLYQNSSVFEKGWGVIKGFFKRFCTVLFQLRQYDYVFVHREASPIGPPVFEFLVAKAFGKKMIYDFDDAIWIPDLNNSYWNWLKAFWKVKWICRWSHKVIAGNEYLRDYANKYNKNVVLIPTCVDTMRRHNVLKDQAQQPVTVGWTGSHSTLKYLDPFVSLLAALAKEFSVRILVICNQPPSFSFDGLDYIRWSEETEISDLLKMNIGIMPLTQDEWSEGKCGFKLIQYLSLGIPAVASPVGVNPQIIGDNNNELSLLCVDENEWRKALATLILDRELRSRIGTAGREKVIARYSIQANERRFLSVFE
jgi:glycosyltransferase involved in cell wall biosynthesis